eukprot:scpid49593/ scgid16338/ 
MIHWLFQCFLLNYYALPLLGAYDQDDYEVLQPIGLLHLSDISISMGPHGEVQHVGQWLPDDVKHSLESLSTSVQIRHAVVIHSYPVLATALDEVNVLPHTWLLASRWNSVRDSDGSCDREATPEPAWSVPVVDWQSEVVDAVVHIGVYSESPGVHCVRQDIAEELNGLRFGQLSPRLIHIHDGRFSPNNCQVGLTSELCNDTGEYPPFTSFYTIMQDQESCSRAACAVFHLVPTSNTSMDSALKCLSESRCLGELLPSMHARLGDFHALHILENLVGAGNAGSASRPQNMAIT